MRYEALIVSKLHLNCHLSPQPLRLIALSSAVDVLTSFPL